MGRPDRFAEQQARDIIDSQVATIRDSWTDVADKIELTENKRNLLRGRHLLNDYAFDGYS